MGVIKKVRVALVGKDGSIPSAEHPAKSVLPDSTRNVPCTVLADIKWTTARPNAVYKDMRGRMCLGCIVYHTKSEAMCKMT